MRRRLLPLLLLPCLLLTGCWQDIPIVKSGQNSRHKADQRRVKRIYPEQQRPEGALPEALPEARRPEKCAEDGTRGGTDGYRTDYNRYHIKGYFNYAYLQKAERGKAEYREQCDEHCKLYHCAQTFIFHFKFLYFISFL